MAQDVIDDEVSSREVLSSDQISEASPREVFERR
jgi:hypothetical protein